MNTSGFSYNIVNEQVCPYNEEAVNYLIEAQYKSGKRMMRCCHPRDIVDQIINLCTFLQTEPRLSREYLDYACNVYFAAMGSI